MPFSLEEHAGPLFDAEGQPQPADALVLTLASDLGAPKGVSARLHERFMAREELAAQNPSPGRTLSLMREGRRVYYMVTRPRSRQRATYAYLARALINLRDKIGQHNVATLAMPCIASGPHSQLDWLRVKRMIIAALGDLNIAIHVYTK